MLTVCHHVAPQCRRHTDSAGVLRGAAGGQIRAVEFDDDGFEIDT